MVPASKGKRFTNYIIDQFINSVLILGLYAVQSTDFLLEANNSWWDTLINYAIFVSYYVLFEGVNDGKTPGKYLTKTRVVSVNGDELSNNAVMLRSFSRIVPFDALSFLGSPPDGWHDRWSDTMVIDEEKSTFISN